MADIVLVNKVDSAQSGAVAQVVTNVREINPAATIVHAASPVTLGPGPSLVGKRVLVVEDGPSVTHGGMPIGAGTVAARQGGARELVDPRPFAVGSIAGVFAQYPEIGPVLPAMGYSERQLEELSETMRATDCDIVVIGTPVDLARLVDVGHPVRTASYELREVGEPSLTQLLQSRTEKWRRSRR